MTFFLLVLLAAFAFEYINGFHDSANAIATVVSTKVLTPRQAIIWAACWNMVGALSGTAVAATIGKGLVDTNVVTMRRCSTALLSAIIWICSLGGGRVPSEHRRHGHDVCVHQPLADGRRQRRSQKARRPCSNTLPR